MSGLHLHQQRRVAGIIELKIIRQGSDILHYGKSGVREIVMAKAVIAADGIFIDRPEQINIENISLDLITEGL